MSAIDIFGLLVPVTYLVMLEIEALFPARQFPPIPYWRLKGFCFLTVQGLLATLSPLVIPEHWLAAHRLINLEGLGVVGGAVLGYAVVSLASYAWHRSAHTFSPMWRLFHQIHHSPQRVDMSGAALFHPLETVAFLLIGALVTTLVLGLDPVAAALTGYIAAFYGYFQHLNIRTRNGSASSSSDRKPIASITSATCTPIITATCRSGTCCSAPSAIQRVSKAQSDSTSPPPIASARC
jgi:sterol desaturase/sphingolipid hydroxylase (fatty acid hydroxylase superfamily)